MNLREVTTPQALELLVQAFCQDQRIDMSKAVMKVTSANGRVCNLAYPSPNFLIRLWDKLFKHLRIVRIELVKVEKVNDTYLTIHGIINGTPCSINVETTA